MYSMSSSHVMTNQNGKQFESQHSRNQTQTQSGVVQGTEQHWDSHSKNYSQQTFRNNQLLSSTKTPQSQGFLQPLFPRQPNFFRVSPVSKSRKKRLIPIKKPQQVSQSKKHQRYRQQYEEEIKKIHRERRRLKARLQKVKRKLARLSL